MFWKIKTIEKIAFTKSCNTLSKSDKIKIYLAKIG